jgi:hypothetical protein
MAVPPSRRRRTMRNRSSTSARVNDEVGSSMINIWHSPITPAQSLPFAAGPRSDRVLWFWGSALHPMCPTGWRPRCTSIAPVNPATGFNWLPPYKNILGDIKVREQAWLLVNGGNTVLARFTRVGKLNLLALQLYLSGGWLVYAGDNLDQRRFSGSVFTQNSVYLARI